MAQKLEAAAQVYATGDAEAAAKALPFSITGRTIRKWRQFDPDFQSHYEQLLEDNEELSRIKWRRLIQGGLDALVDRVEKGNVKAVAVDGEYLTDEDGNFIRNERGKKILETAEYREPMTSKDLTYTTGIMIDKYRVSLGQPSRITKSADTNTDMAGQFKNIYKDFQKLTEEVSVVSIQDKDKP